MQKILSLTAYSLEHLYKELSVRDACLLETRCCGCIQDRIPASSGAPSKICVKQKAHLISERAVMS